MANITVPIERTDELILKYHLASASRGDEHYDISISVPPGALIFQTPRGKYLVKVEDLLADILRMEQGGVFDAP